MISFRIKEKYGKHIMEIDGKERRFKTGDIVTVKHPDDLGNSLDKFIRLTPEESEGVSKEEVKKKFKVKQRKGKLRQEAIFDVFNLATGKPVNDDGLTIQEAEDLAGDMESS